MISFTIIYWVDLTIDHGLIPLSNDIHFIKYYNIALWLNKSNSSLA